MKEGQAEEIKKEKRWDRTRKEERRGARINEHE
jgi:hypothetical protein